MLKKILSIFFILCLVFSLTVPCFAYTDVGGALVLDNIGYTGSVSFNNPTNSYNARTLFAFRVEAGHRYALFCYSDPSGSGGTNVPIFLLIRPNSSTVYNITRDNQYSVTPFTFDVTANSTFSVQLVVYTAGDFSFHYSFLIFEIPFGTTPSEVADLLPDYNVSVFDDLPRESYTFFLDGFTGEEIPEFLSSTLHTFDFLGLSTVPYIPLLIVFFGITAILTFIFVIVFMIKRLTGGS